MKYIGWIDDLRGLGIVLIVAGHVVATLGNMTGGAGQAAMFKVFDAIYSFHVPFFFVLAGLTFSGRKGFVELVKGKFFRLMLPYYLWGGICALVYGIVGQSVSSTISSVSTTSSFANKTLHGAWWIPILSILHGGGWPDGNGLSFNGVLWFLPVLFFCELLYHVLVRICPRPTLRFAIASLALVFLGRYTYYRDVPYHILWCVRFMPYIAFGHWLQDILNLNGKAESDEKESFRMSVVVLLVAMSVLCIIPKTSYQYWAGRQVKALTIIIALVAVARLGYMRLFRIVSATTMGIMIFHKFPLVAAQVLIGKAGVLKVSCNDSMFVVYLSFIAAVIIFVLVAVCHYSTRLVIRVIPWSFGMQHQKVSLKQQN